MSLKHLPGLRFILKLSVAIQGVPVLLLTFQLPKQTQISKGPKAMLGQLKSLKLAKSLKSRLHMFIAKLDSYQG